MTLLLIELNEINFRMVQRYLESGAKLTAFSRMMKCGVVESSSEASYELLEPWIQWPSVHTGKTYDDHKVFRLGDIIKFEGDQIFEVVERMGFKVGAISPMNGDNRLKKPCYFIPDPWTDTASDSSLISRLLTGALRQAVNQNSQAKLSVSTLFSLVLVFFVTVRKSALLRLISYAITSYGRPWRKALFLDQFLHEVHLWLLRRESPDFSTIFFNAGAHIQHHYFLNSPYFREGSAGNPSWYLSETEDPCNEMLFIYDRLLTDYLELGVDLIVATGLSQKPISAGTFYYRLRDHENFLRLLGIPFRKVEPRMTRDFLVICESKESANTANNILRAIMVDDNEPLFGEVEIRGEELFVTLTYPREITRKTIAYCRGASIRLLDSVVFVAVKNGEHDGTGYIYMSANIPPASIQTGDHVLNLYCVIKEYFSRQAR